MSIYKLTDSHKLIHTVVSHPKWNLLFTDLLPTASVGIINNSPTSSFGDGTLSIRIEELNNTSSKTVYPYITKDSTRVSFKTISVSDYDSTFTGGSIVTGTYDNKSTITTIPIDSVGDGGFNQKYLYSLRNTLEYNSILSPHFAMSSSIYNFDKAQQSIRLINIPSMFFGSAIEKGSVELRMIRTSPATLPPGTLSSSLNTPPPDGKSIAILRDSKLDGTLIQTYDSDLVEKTSTNDNKVAGMVLYNQGIILLTGSWQLTRFTGSGGYSHPFGNAEPAWINFGDRNTDDEYLCYLSFRGTTRTPVRTVFANAPVNELNHSNNPTYLSYGQTFSYGTYSGSILLPAVDSFVESSNIKVANTHGDSYSEEVLTLDNLSPSGSNFVKQTYLSKVILYDDNKIPIAVVKLSSPLRKREKDSLSVKVLLDL